MVKFKLVRSVMVSYDFVLFIFVNRVTLNII